MLVLENSETLSRATDRLVQLTDCENLIADILGSKKTARSFMSHIMPIGDLCSDFSTVLHIRRAITDRTPESLGITVKQHRSLLAAIILGSTIDGVLKSGQNIKPIDSPDLAACLMSEAIGYKSIEHGAIVALDIKHIPIASHVFSIGDQTSCLMDIKAIVKFLLSVNATRFFLYHNHPSGSIEPSREDIQITRSIHAGSRLMGFELLDHIILACGRHQSIREVTNIWD
jgi:DNA repair protein RadC